MADDALASDKDVPMEELEEKIVDDLLASDKEDSVNEEEGDEENAQLDKEEEEKARQEEEKKRQEEEERKKKEEEERKKREEEEDAASDAEIEAEDDRITLPSSVDGQWQWHIEVYPLATDDMMLDNFSRLCGTASYSQVVFREPEPDVKKGEAHFYADNFETAKTIVRTLCCKRLAYQRPYIYIYRRKDPKKDEFETAVLRLDLLEVAKVRWDKQKRAKGDPNTRIAKVTNVPRSTSRDMLRVIFARAYRVKMDTVMSAADTKNAKAAKAAREKEKAKRKAEAKAAKAQANEANEDEEEEDSESDSDEEEEVFGRFEGTVTVDCCTRASLKGFLLGYRKVAIGETLVDIKPLSSDEIDVEELRKEARKRRWEEAVNGPTWIPVPPKARFVREEWGPPDYYPMHPRRGGRGGGDRGRGGFDRGRGSGDRSRGARGGGFDRGRGGWDRGRGGERGRGGVRTGRQSYEEKMQRWGGSRRGGYDDRYGEDRFHGYGGYGRPPPPDYGSPPRGYGPPRGYDYGYGPGYRGGHRDEGRYGYGGGGGYGGRR